MLTEVGEVVLEHLLEKLKKLPHLGIVEAVEGHDRELGYHVAKGHESLVLIHVKKEDRCDVGHPLNITYVWSVHRESLENPLQMLIML